jgi:hypothetical protein
VKDLLKDAKRINIVIFTLTVYIFLLHPFSHGRSFFHYLTKIIFLQEWMKITFADFMPLLSQVLAITDKIHEYLMKDYDPSVIDD